MRDGKNGKSEYPRGENSEITDKPRREDEKKLLPTILGLTVMFIILLVILYAVVHSMEPEGTNDHSAQINVLEVTDTTALAEIQIDLPTQPVNFMIVLNDESRLGTYTFPSNEDGVILSLESGDDMGMITYLDMADNGLVDSGDKVYAWLLSPGTEYQIRFLYKNGHVYDSDVFTTTTG